MRAALSFPPLTSEALAPSVPSSPFAPFKSPAPCVSLVTPAPPSAFVRRDIPVAHAGLYRFDTQLSDVRRAQERDAARLVDALSVDALDAAPRSSEPGRRDASGVSTHVEGPVAIACASRVVGVPAASVLAAWPCGRTLVWDGRLDNRAALRGQLRDRLEGRASDADIVLAAYVAWGIDAFEVLIGDFALVVWDPIERRLLLARDFSGVRPLCYSLTSSAGELVWSSDLETFLRLGADRAGTTGTTGSRGSLSLDDAYLRHFMTESVDHTSTPYAGVHGVPPGTCVIVQQDGRIRRADCWRPDPHATLRYRRDADYQEHFLECFREAVRNRLPDNGPVWAELSGGLDSSAIVCVADDLLRSEATAERLHTISYVPPDRAAGDERPYLESVERKIGRPAFRLREHGYSAFLADRCFPDSPYLDTPFLSRPVSVAGRYLKVAEMLKSWSGQVLLSGHAGDSVMWSTLRRCPHLADLLASLRLVALHRAIRQYDAGSRTYWNLLRHEAIAPLLPRGFQRRRIVAPYLVVPAEDDSSPHVPEDETPRALAPSREMSFRLLLAAIGACAYHRMRTCGAGVVDAAFPFLDRRVVQFMLAAPFDQKVRHGTSRWLLRRSLDGLLPEEVATRRSKASGQGFLCRAVSREWSGLQRIFGADARTARRGLVRLPLLREALERARRGLDVDALALTRAIAVETWLRQHEIRAPRPMAVRQ
jgi:asparagine synthase (glutamine-hydrolysing)